MVTPPSPGDSVFPKSLQADLNQEGFSIMRFVSAAAFALLFSIASFAQNDRGTITGTVTDQAGAVVPNASVTAVNTETAGEFKTVTTATGNYTIPSLVVGRYQLNVEQSGFRKFTQENIQ